MTFRSIVGFGSYLLAVTASQAMTSPVSPQLPFAFVENRGQSEARIRYIGTGTELKAWFEDRGVVLQQGKTAVRISFEESSPLSQIAAEHPIGATANYLRGNDPREWQTQLPLFGALRYSGAWPGIDLIYKADKDAIKAEYVVAPRADPEEIRLRFEGSPGIQPDGSLRVSGAGGSFIEDKPFLYQVAGDKRIEVEGGFKTFPNGSVGFWTAEFDRTQPLVVDPSILFSGYFGGSSQDAITGVAIDALGNIVVAGWTASADLPTTSGARKRNAGGVDAFVASFLPNGNLIYCTYLGGSGDDRAFGLAIDNARNVYVTGWTSSANFPVLGALQIRLSGTRDAFITKLNAAGSALVYSTYLGGSGVDVGNAIGLDATNSAVIVGDSTSPNLPITSGAFQKKLAGAQDVFVAKLSPQGSSLVFLTYLGGTGIDHGSCLNVGTGGAYFIGGYTWSSNFPTAQAAQPKSGGGQDGFIGKLSADGSTLLYGSYLGGYGGSVGAPEEVNAIYRDSSGYIMVAGTTSSANFPVTQGALQTVFGGGTDGFIARFSTSWKLLAATFVGGSANDGVTAMATDFHGLPYITGFTNSQDFPVQRPWQNANAGGMDAFVMKLSNSLTTAFFGSYLGGSASDAGNAIAVDGQSSIVVAGQTSSGDFPIAGGMANLSFEILGSFITKIAPSFTLGVSYGSQSQMAFTADPWHVSSYVSSTLFGNATDLPIVGDWTGSGTKRIGIFRNGNWILDTNGNGIIDASDKTISFGQAGDIPVVGDWKGSGRIALGLFRQGTFILDLSGHLTGIPTGLSDVTFAFGQGGDLPVIADWNGSGVSKVGVFRNGLWLVDYNGDRVYNGLDRSYVYGQAGDVPVVGDWDSSGNPAKIGVYRAGLWVLDYDGDNVWTTPYVNEMALGFGFAGYAPLVF